MTQVSLSSLRRDDTGAIVRLSLDDALAMLRAADGFGDRDLKAAAFVIRAQGSSDYGDAFELLRKVERARSLA